MKKRTIGILLLGVIVAVSIIAVVIVSLRQTEETPTPSAQSDLPISYSKETTCDVPPEMITWVENFMPHFADLIWLEENGFVVASEFERYMIPDVIDTTQKDVYYYIDPSSSMRFPYDTGAEICIVGNTSFESGAPLQARGKCTATASRSTYVFTVTQSEQAKVQFGFVIDGLSTDEEFAQIREFVQMWQE